MYGFEDFVTVDWNNYSPGEQLVAQIVKEDERHKTKDERLKALEGHKSLNKQKN